MVIRDRSEVFHRAAGGKIENIFLFLNTVFWALLALIVGAAGFSLATGSVIGHGIILFCIVGYTGTVSYTHLAITELFGFQAIINASAATTIVVIRPTFNTSLSVASGLKIS